MNVTYEDLVVRLGAINDRMAHLRVEIQRDSGVSYFGKCARHVSLDGIQQSLIACGMWIKLWIFTNGVLAEQRVTLQEFLQVPFADEQSAKYMFNFKRLSLVTLVHFKIDSLFGDILKFLNITPKGKGFYHRAVAILGLSGISVSGQEMAVLKCMANIRNSLHNNGIHHGQDLAITVGGFSFGFKDQNPVECASWPQILGVINEGVSVLQLVLQSKAIREIHVEIPEAYSLRKVTS